jgi:2,3-bisphosphoglycerate-independent phosphoglycerate mutase
MTSLLEKALRKAGRLPESEQDRIAQVILDEIEEEARWQASFARSQDQLAALAAAARDEIARGEVRDEDPSTASE